MDDTRPFQHDIAPARGAAIRSLIGGCIGMAMGASPIVILSFGVYQQAIVRNTGWDRATVASAIGPTMILAGAMSPFAGLLVNRFGPRRFVTAGFPLCGLGVMLLAAPGSAVMFAVTMALVGVLCAGQSMIPYVYAVSGWFGNRRGLALGTVLAFTGVGLAIMPPLAAQLIAHFGWRFSYLAFGAAMVLVGIPVGRFLIVDPPAAAAGDREAVPGIPWRRAVTNPVFWYLSISIMLVGGAVSAGVVNLSIILTERGVNPQRASFIMSLVGISMILARLLVGHLFDRMRAQQLTAIMCALTGCAFVVLLTTSGSAGVLIGAVLIGIGFGAEGDAMSYMISRAFGMRDYGTIFGIMFLAFTLGGGFGPLVFAQLHAHSGDYQLALECAVIACGVATALILLIRESDLPYGGHLAKEQMSEHELLPLTTS